ncbi:MAG: hypothetical protein AAB897_02615 [Patescibacteria group bacterium]
MGRRDRKRRQRKNPRKNRQRIRHHNHTLGRISLRYKLRLGHSHLGEIISLIRKNRSEKVQFVKDGRVEGSAIYIVIFCGVAMPFVYHARERWLITCLRLGKLLRSLHNDQEIELRAWLTEKGINTSAPPYSY